MKGSRSLARTCKKKVLTVTVAWTVTLGGVPDGLRTAERFDIVAVASWDDKLAAVKF